MLDQDTHEVLYSKNPEAVLPIASLSKLMTALVISEAHQSLDEPLEITNDDIDTEKGTHSRLTPGTQLPRGVMLHLALMSSENRAANALGRNYPGGLAAFIPAMNAKARELGMLDTHYVEPTGLSSQNKSSARDLAVLVNAAHQVPLLREYSTTPSLDVELGRRQVQFHTTDRLVANPTWDIGLQKTGFINGSGPMPGDAGPDGRPQADHGAARFRRQVFAHRRRRTHPQVGHDQSHRAGAGRARRGRRELITRCSRRDNKAMGRGPVARVTGPFNLGGLNDALWRGWILRLRFAPRRMTARAA